MKRSTIISVCVAFFFGISLLALGNDDPTKKDKMPENVKAVVEKSCFGCHNTDSKNEDAKEELDFKKLGNLSIIKKIGAYKEIGEVIEEAEMPPKKFLQRFPDKALSDDEKTLLMTWSKKEAEALVKSK